MAKKTKLNLEIVGKTREGQMVLSGESIFKFVDTKGMPLENILMCLPKEEYAIDWISFVDCCLMSGWKYDTMLSKIESAIAEIWGKDYSQNIVQRIEHWSNL